MMLKLIQEVNKCANREYNRAGAQHGPLNHTDHESYALILEELEEAFDEAVSCRPMLDEFWEMVKKDSDDEDKLKCLKSIERKAVLAACEFIQVAAMCIKASLTLRKENKR